MIPMAECFDRIEFIEQLTQHLRDCQFESSKDIIDRRIAEMVNLLETRQIILSPDDMLHEAAQNIQTPLKNI